MKVGNLVICQRHSETNWHEGLIVGFGTKGEGGKDYVHVLIDGNVEVFMRFNVEVVTKKK